MIGRGIRTFFKFSFKDKLLVLYTFCLCGIVRLAILTVPFTYIRMYLGKHNVQSTDEVEKRSYKIAYKIRRIVVATAKYTPWQSKCLVQAIVAQHLLKKYHLGTTIYFGVAKDGEGKLQAHAWLRYGKMIVTGGEVAGYFQTVGYFSNETVVN